MAITVTETQPSVTHNTGLTDAQIASSTDGANRVKAKVHNGLYIIPKYDTRDNTNEPRVNIFTYNNATDTIDILHTETFTGYVGNGTQSLDTGNHIIVGDNLYILFFLHTGLREGVVIFYRQNLVTLGDNEVVEILDGTEMVTNQKPVVWYDTVSSRLRLMYITGARSMGNDVSVYNRSSRAGLTSGSFTSDNSFQSTALGRQFATPYYKANGDIYGVSFQDAAQTYQGFALEGGTIQTIPFNYFNHAFQGMVHYDETNNHFMQRTDRNTNSTSYGINTIDGYVYQHAFDYTNSPAFSSSANVSYSDGTRVFWYNFGNSSASYWGTTTVSDMNNNITTNIEEGSTTISGVSTTHEADIWGTEPNGDVYVKILDATTGSGFIARKIVFNGSSSGGPTTTVEPTTAAITIGKFNPTIEVQMETSISPATFNVAIATPNPTVIATEVIREVKPQTANIGMVAYNLIIKATNPPLDDMNKYEPMGKTNELLARVFVAANRKPDYQNYTWTSSNWSVASTLNTNPICALTLGRNMMGRTLLIGDSKSCPELDFTIDLVNRYGIGEPSVDLKQVYDVFADVVSNAVDLPNIYQVDDMFASIPYVDLVQTYDLAAQAGTVQQIDLTERHQVFGKSFETDLLDLINAERTNQGLDVLYTQWAKTVDNRDIAHQHSHYCVEVPIIAHDDPSLPAEWNTLAKRKDFLEPSAGTTTENVLAIFNSTSTPENLVTAQDFFDLWKASPPHYANMMLDWPIGSAPEMMFGCDAKSVVGDVYDAIHGFNYNLSTWGVMVYATTVFYDKTGAFLVPSTVDLKQVYDLNAPHTIDLLTEYSVDAYVSVKQGLDGVYALKVSAGMVAPYSSKVGNSMVCPITWRVQQQITSPFGSTGDIQSDLHSIYTINDGVPVRAELVSTFTDRLTSMLVSAFDDTTTVKSTTIAEVNSALEVHASIISAINSAPEVKASFIAEVNSAAVAQSNTLSTFEDAPTVKQTTESTLGDAQTVRHTLASTFGETPTIKASMVVSFDDVAQVRKSLQSSLGDMQTLKSSLEATFSINNTILSDLNASNDFLDSVSGDLTGLYDLRLTERARASTVGIMNLLDDNTNYSVYDLYLTAAGKRMEIENVNIDTSMEEFGWVASVDLKVLEDYHLLPRNTPVVINYFGEQFSMIVDTPSVNRSSQVGNTYNVKLISPTAVYQYPRAARVDITIEESKSAKEIVESILGVSVTWNIINWNIPAFRVSMLGVSPLDAVAKIVGAVGGVISTAPDGTIEIIPEHKYNPDQYSNNETHTFSDYDANLSASSSEIYTDGFNRFRVMESLAGFSDSIEFIRDEKDGEQLTSGTLRVYTSPRRSNVVLHHTEDKSIILNLVGEATHTVTDTVEFKAGAGNLSKPAQSVTSVVWETESLGSVTIPQGTVTASAPTSVNYGYGVATITYEAVAIEYRTSIPVGDIVQFILEDLG